jgi:hypothetical protein
MAKLGYLQPYKYLPTSGLLCTGIVMAFSDKAVGEIDDLIRSKSCVSYIIFFVVSFQKRCFSSRRNGSRGFCFPLMGSPAFNMAHRGDKMAFFGNIDYDDLNKQDYAVIRAPSPAWVPLAFSLLFRPTAFLQ